MAAKKSKYTKINRSLYFPLHICIGDGVDREATIQLPIMSYDSSNKAANFVASCLVGQGEDGGYGDVGINIAKANKRILNPVTSGNTKTIIKRIVKCLKDLKVQAADGTGRQIPDLCFPYFTYADAANLAKKKGVSINDVIDRCADLMYEYDPSTPFHSFNELEDMYDNS